MSGKVTDSDRGLKELRARLAALKGARVRVGVLADAPKRPHAGEEPSEMTLVEVAAVHEFGAPARGIPQRSFIRATVDEKRADVAKLQEVLLGNVTKGKMTADQALDAMGAKVAAWCKTRIAAGIAPPLKPETVARKKSSKPLVDTGQLRSSITWKVVR